MQDYLIPSFLPVAASNEEKQQEWCWLVSFFLPTCSNKDRCAKFYLKWLYPKMRERSWGKGRLAFERWSNWCMSRVNRILFVLPFTKRQKRLKRGTLKLEMSLDTGCYSFPDETLGLFGKSLLKNSETLNCAIKPPTVHMYLTPTTQKLLTGNRITPTVMGISCRFVSQLSIVLILFTIIKIFCAVQNTFCLRIRAVHVCALTLELKWSSGCFDRDH